ncbi:hypothetical protein BASA50_003651 [Batrachochytrium salamandrivorans]|nr:hypothetical protein BASA50_003651 [Batrachochytrium salamandrivorans]
MRPKHIHTGTLPSISAGDIQHTSEGNALPDLSNPTVSSTTAGESVSIASEIEETIDIPSNTVYPSSNFQSTAPLEAAFFAQNIEVGVSSHILFLVRQLTQSKQPRVSIHSTTSGSNRVYVKDYSDVFSKSLPSTPSAVFSSSGIIYTCNIAFARLVQLDHATLVSGQFCVFSLVDMPSMLSVLDLALSYSLKKDAQSFGRCSVFSGGNTRPQSYQQHPHQQPTSQSQGGQRTWIRHCSLAISTLHDSGLWVVAQFIPIM